MYEYVCMGRGTWVETDRAESGPLVNGLEDFLSQNGYRKRLSKV